MAWRLEQSLPGYGCAQTHANSVQLAFRARLDRCFARQGSFKFFSGPVSLFFLVLFSFSVVLFSVSVVVFSFFLVRGGSMRNPRSVNNYQRQRQRTKRTSSLKS